MTTPAYLRELSAYLAGASFADFPQAVIDRAVQVLTDSIAVIGAGAAEPEMVALRRELSESSAGGKATVIGADLPAPIKRPS